MPHQDTTRGHDRAPRLTQRSMTAALGVLLAASLGCVTQQRRSARQTPSDSHLATAPTPHTKRPTQTPRPGSASLRPRAPLRRSAPTAPLATNQQARQPDTAATVRQPKATRSTALVRSPKGTRPQAPKPPAPRVRKPARHHSHQEGSFRVSVADLPCQGCRQSLRQMVRKYKGVSKVHLTRSAELCVHFSKRKTSPQRIMGRATRTPIVCLYEKVRKARAIRWPKGADVKIITTPKRSKQVRFKRHLARGKVTIFDFYADWCGPCKSLDRWMRHLVRTNKQLAIRKVNIDHWGEAIARRFLKRSGGLPYLIIYNRKGKRSAIVKGFDPAELQKAIAKAM